MRLGTVLASLVVAGCSSATAVTVAPPRSGGPTSAVAPAAPDELFPLAGNLGYDVEHYDMDLSYDPPTAALAGAVKITAVAETELPLVSFDLGLMTLDAVGIDGVAVVGNQAMGKLWITPPAPVPAGARFVVDIVYRGVPQPRPDPALGSPLGWVTTLGGSYVRNKPDAASTWFPSNDHPSDKATYRIRVAVPAPFAVAASGTLVAEEQVGPVMATTWDTSEPMASYEVQIAVGQLVRVDTATPAGLPMSTFIAAGSGDVGPAVSLAGRMLDRFSELFGPYPFAAAGLIATDSPSGLAVEAHGRPVLSAADMAAPPSVRQQSLLSEQLAHQWFGAAVTPARWRDVWLSDGFTTYAKWLWLEHAGEQTADDAADRALGRSAQHRRVFGPPDSPRDAATLFNPSVVDGGAVVLHALRLTVGDDTFFEILRTWVATYGGQSVDTDTFVHHASSVTGQDLADFFTAWLSSEEVPAAYPQVPT